MKAPSFAVLRAVGAVSGWVVAAGSFRSRHPGLRHAGWCQLVSPLAGCNNRLCLCLCLRLLPCNQASGSRRPPPCPHTCPSRLARPLAPQGETVRLGNSHAALLEGRGHSWADALAEGSRWQLVRVLQP